MFKILRTRIKQGYRTHSYPEKSPDMPEKFNGRPVITKTCPADCRDCIDICPTEALEHSNGQLTIDCGRCLFCGNCVKTCQHEVISFSREYRLAASSRDDLIFKGDIYNIAKGLDKQSQRLFGHSLKLRQVSAGGCNACESDTNVLNTLTYDLGRFGIQFVASPRHADGLLITGPVTANMKRALEKTYAAVPAPKLVIAVGACAISGGPFIGHEETHDGADCIVPVDLYIPGCPPSPWTILDGILRLLGRI